MADYIKLNMHKKQSKTAGFFQFSVELFSTFDFINQFSCCKLSKMAKKFIKQKINKIFQNSTAMGICCTDGVVLGVEKLIPFKMMEPTSTRRIFNADRHVGIAVCGWQPDGRQMVNKARSECISYRDFYGNKIPAKILVERLSLRFHYYTLYWSMRALGTTVLVATYDEFGPSLHMIEPSGETNGYYGIAIGKGKQSGKTELEKLQLDKMTCKEAIKQIARM